MAARPVDGDRGVRGRLRRALGAPAPRFQHRPLRPRQHGAGRVVDGARRRARGDGAPGAAVLAARRALRPDPRRLRAALVAVARPDDARSSSRRSRSRSARVPVFLLARKHLDSERAGVGFALAYLLYPPTQWLALNEFHPVALATPLLLAAFWFLDEDRLVPFAVVAVAACLTKEHIGLVVAALGALVRVRRAAAAAPVSSSQRAGDHGLRRGDRARRAALRPGGLVAVRGSLPARSAAARSAIAETLVTDPLRVLGEMFDGHGLPYLLELLLPLAALPLLAPLAAATALPELLANLLSTTRTQQSIHFHYTAAAIPGLVAAAVFGAARLRTRRDLVTGLVLVALAVELRARSRPAVALLPRRRGSRHAGARRHRARPDRRAGAAPDPGRRRRHRDELARRRICPAGGACSASRCSTTQRGSRRTRRGRATATGSRRWRRARRCAGSGSTRTGGSSSTRTASRSSARA